MDIASVLVFDLAGYSSLTSVQVTGTMYRIVTVLDRKIDEQRAAGESPDADDLIWLRIVLN